VLANRLTDGVSISDNEVEDTRGEPGFLDHPSGHERGQGGQLGGLQHDGVSGSESRADLPAQHQNYEHEHVSRCIPRGEKTRKERTGEVPGDDLSNDTEWLIEGVDKLIFVGLDGLTVRLVGPASIVPDGVDGEANVRVLSPFEGLAWYTTYRQVPRSSATGLIRLDKVKPTDRYPKPRRRRARRNETP